MSGDSEFRSTEQEVQKLLEECAELRRTLQAIGAQLGRIENRVKRAFPAVAAKTQRGNRDGPSGILPSISRDEALAEFDRIVTLAASGASEEAERVVQCKTTADLSVIARELGVSFPKGKPSARLLRDAIFGKIRESVLLGRHHQRT